MTRIIAIASGKGGVGKTSLAANLGVALAKMGKRVLVVDTDLQMANLGLMLGMEGRPITLQDVLAGEASLADAIYDGPGGIRFVPAGLSIEKFRRVDDEKLADVIKELAEQADIVLLDTAAGIGNDVLASLHGATEVLVVTMAESIAVADALKLIMIAERRLGLDITGVVVEMYKDMKQEMTSKEIQKALQTEVLAVIPEDPQFRECSLEGTPVVLKHPTSLGGTAVINLAAKLIGAPPPMIEAKKPGLLDAILGLLRPKKRRDLTGTKKAPKQEKPKPAPKKEEAKPPAPAPKEEAKPPAPKPPAAKAPTPAAKAPAEAAKAPTPAAKAPTGAAKAPTGATPTPAAKAPTGATPTPAAKAPTGGTPTTAAKTPTGGTPTGVPPSSSGTGSPGASAPGASSPGTGPAGASLLGGVSKEKRAEDQKA
ncbi:MAG: cell division ATPase MinD [Candidatus Diapherotrites archaeon]|nr:cell division ATPase MinD [Candidatus Diapherotrites archaeon]